MPLHEAFLMYGYSVASTLVQNAVRAIPLGQKEGQVILRDIVEEIATLYQPVSHLTQNFLGANSQA